MIIILIIYLTQIKSSKCLNHSNISRTSSVIHINRLDIDSLIKSPFSHFHLIIINLKTLINNSRNAFTISNTFNLCKSAFSHIIFGCIVFRINDIKVCETWTLSLLIYYAYTLQYDLHQCCDESTIRRKCFGLLKIRTSLRKASNSFSVVVSHNHK